MVITRLGAEVDGEAENKEAKTCDYSGIAIFLTLSPWWFYRGKGGSKWSP
jgi:hypothetical protein